MQKNWPRSKVSWNGVLGGGNDVCRHQGGAFACVYLVCVVLHSRDVIKIVICTFALVLCGLLLCTSRCVVSVRVGSLFLSAARSRRRGGGGDERRAAETCPIPRKILGRAGAFVCEMSGRRG